MRTNKRKLVAWLSMAVISLNASGQMDSIFSKLPSFNFQTNYFYPKSFGPPLPDGSGVDTLNAERGDQYIYSLSLSQLQFSELPNFSSFQQLSQQIMEDEQAIPLSLIDLYYDDFSVQAIRDSLIRFEDDYLISPNTEAGAIYSTKHCFFLHVSKQNYSHRNLRFILKSEMVFSNTGRNLQNLEIDFDDGLGYRPFPIDEPFTVQYGHQKRDRLIRLRATNDEPALETSFVLKSSGPRSDFPEPQLPPWQAASDNLPNPWQISALLENGAPCYGNAYTLMSDDGVFDKPFIFVEGIDFSRDHEAYRYGDFGWYEFSSGKSIRYPFLSNMPALLESLREAGYDLILLDFKDGADYVQNNALLLMELIRKVNRYKVGDQPNVVAGASMGGQVSRYALRKMELQGEDHCTRLWISMDSPHKGANIPIGLQFMIQDLAPQNAAAKKFIDAYLNRPAAKQFLLQQLSQFPNGDKPTTGPSLFQSYYSELDQMGFPQETRNIAIANGNMHGQKLPFTQYNPLLDYTCGNGLSTLAKFYILPTPGDKYHTRSSGSMNVISELKQGAFNGVSTRRVPNNIGFWDNLPGGTRTTMHDFVESINQQLRKNEINWLGGLIQIDLCNPISENEYKKHHCFIPTTSALASSAQSNTLDLTAAINAEQTAVPFDNYFGPEYGNEQHSEITTENSIFVLQEVLGGENPLPNFLDQRAANQGVFNFGKPEFSILYNVELGHGAQVLINHPAPTHFATSTDGFPASSSFRVETKNCGAQVIVSEGGLISIGHRISGRRGQLLIKSGSTLQIEEGGLVEIAAHSELIIQKGATLILNGGKLILENLANLIIEEGANLHFYAKSEIQTDGPDATTHLYGKLHLGANSIFRFSHPKGKSGKLMVFQPYTQIFGAPNAVFHLSGDNSNDPILQIAAGARFDPDPNIGTIQLDKGSVVFGANSQLVARTKFLANYCQFKSDGASSNRGIELFTINNFNACDFNNVFLVAQLHGPSLTLSRCHFEGNGTGIKVVGGGFDIYNCSFINCKGIHAVQSNKKNNVWACEFRNPANQIPGAAIYDEAYDLLEIHSSLFENFEIAVEKQQGILQLSCNDFLGNVRAILGGNNSRVLMGQSNNGGYNYFRRNDINIRLEGALEIDLNLGFNYLNNYRDKNISGYLFGRCQGCFHSLPAHQNIWIDFEGYSNHFQYFFPQPEAFDLHIIDPAYDCGLDISERGCNVVVVDEMPEYQSSCANPYRFAEVFNPSFSPLLSDTFPAIRRDDFSGFISDDFVISSSLSVEESQIKGVTLSPNPHPGNFSLENTGPGDIMGFDVFNIHGVLVAHQDVLIQAHTKLDISLHPDLSDGIYILSLKRQSGFETLRMVLKH